MAQQITPSQESIHRLQKVIERVGYSRASIYALMSAGKFPASVRLGERAIGWRESDISAWIASRASNKATA